MHAITLHCIYTTLYHMTSHCITFALHCITPHYHCADILHAAITLTPTFHIPRHYVPSNRTLGSHIAQGGVLSYARLSAVCLLRMTPTVVHGQNHFLSITCSASHAQPQHRMHNPSIAYTSSASPSFRAEFSEWHCRLEQCSVTRSYCARSRLENQHTASHHSHQHRTCIRTAHSCIPPAEFSAMSISISITPAFSMPLASHSSTCISTRIAAISHDIR